MANEQGNRWIELRDDAGRLHGRLDLTSLLLETKVNKREAVFDLAATLRERRPVVTRVRSPDDSLQK